MTGLGVPTQLRGDWANAVFLTFGAELPFFENALWREFAPSCRRKIILVDGRQYREACNTYARSGLLRFMNLRYAVGGILHPRAAHAKAILLTNEEAGRLLIGSGNLSLQGYASGGELFTRYEYGQESSDGLPAFQAVRDLLEYLVDHQKVLPTVRTYLRQVLDETPWLYAAASAPSLVRHNLTSPFLDQVSAEVGENAVDELWLLSPFFDPGAIALRKLLEALRPAKLRILVQPSLASIDGPAVARTLASFPGDARVLEACRTIDGACTSHYLHAKLLLAKLPDRAICLQGSANLSQVAMLRTAHDGNLELSNLLTGNRDAFDYLLGTLKVSEQPVTLDDLRLHHSEEDRDGNAPTAFELTGGELSGRQLRIYATGEPPATASPRAEIEDSLGNTHLVEEVSYSSDRNELTTDLEERHLRLFQTPTPLRVVWPTPIGDTRTNAIYVVHTAALDQEFGRQEGSTSLTALADLPLDADLEALILKLDKVVLIHPDVFADPWRARGSMRPREAPEAADAESTATFGYEDIDYDKLRNHPRIRQYLPRDVNGGHEPSRIQQLLSSMLDRLKQFVEPHERVVAVQPDLWPDSGADTDEEIAEAADRESCHHSRDRRIRDMFKRFIRRYLTGLEDTRFREFVGVHVMTQNYIIFSHLLLELSKRPWFDDDRGYLVEAFLQLWRGFWGTPTRPGYFQSIEPEEQQAVTRTIEKNEAFAYLLSAFIRMRQAAQENALWASVFSLRDAWRHLLVTLPECLTPTALTTTFKLSGQYAMDEPSAEPVFEDLSDLAHYQTDDRLTREIAERQGLQPSSCAIETVFAGVPTKSFTVTGEQPDHPLETAQAIVADLLRYRQSLKDDQPVCRVVYRTDDGELRGIFHYELHPGRGVHGHYLSFSGDVPSGMTPIPGRIEPQAEPWNIALESASAWLMLLRTSTNQPDVLRGSH